MRKENVYLGVDIETANHAEDALAYDIGLVAFTTSGRILERHSICISEIFEHEADLMQTAYYARKLPSYYEALANGKRKMMTLYEVRELIHEMHMQYRFNAILAYNAYFDYNGMNRTQRYVTKSKYRWFFPYGVPIHCIWHMACQTICSMKKYHKFCIDNGFVSKSGNIQTSAEVVYKFITNNLDFTEEHQGLDDVEIEIEIFRECLKKHKKMDRKINRACWRIPQRKKVKAE